MFLQLEKRFGEGINVRYMSHDTFVMIYIFVIYLYICGVMTLLTVSLDAKYIYMCNTYICV